MAKNITAQNERYLYPTFRDHLSLTHLTSIVDKPRRMSYHYGVPVMGHH
jgi:hypothetical protein